MESILQQVEAEVLHLYIKLKLLSAHIVQNVNCSSVMQETGWLLSEQRCLKFYFRANTPHGPWRHLLISEYGSVHSNHI